MDHSQLNEKDNAKDASAVCCDKSTAKPVAFASIFGWITMNDYRAVQALVSRVKKTNSSSEKSETVSSMLDFILPHVDIVKTDSEFNSSRCRLEALVGLVLDISTKADGIFTYGQEGIKAFDFLVKYTKDALEDIVIIIDVDKFDEDMYEVTHFINYPRHHTEVNLGLFRTPALDRVLGPSKNPEKLKSDSLVRALRLLAILSEVNENPGVLFSGLSRHSLIDRKNFISKAMEDYVASRMSESRNPSLVGEKLLSSLAPHYPFLFSYRTRVMLHDLLRRRLRQRLTIKKTPILVEKPKVLNFVARNLAQFECNKSEWAFNFVGEKARCIRESTMEFYRKFSVDSQIIYRDVWIDDLLFSPAQLFPRPKLFQGVAPIKSELYLKAIGRVMAQAILSGNRLNLIMSNACYKCMFTPCPEGQRLTLVDIKDVFPSSVDFLANLVRSLRKKWTIENNMTLTPLERIAKISDIKCGDCSFDDLEINFTVPGVPTMELIRGGKRMFLSIENAHEYLQLLVWHVLNEGTRECMNNLQDSFELIAPSRLMNMFYPDEICSLLSRSLV